MHQELETDEELASMDTATIVVATMKKRGISGLPRNYELVYEALNKSNLQLSKAFAALGSQPGQSEMDELGKKFFPHHHGDGVVNTARSKISGELDDILGRLRQEKVTLEDYNSVLDENAGKLSTASAPADLMSVTEALAQATGDKIENSKAIIDNVINAASELTKVKQQLDEYKAIANTDPLTRLANRRAFDEAMSKVYDSNLSIGSNVLILMDIDHFKRFNDTHGHPIGDRVLGLVAATMKSEVRDDCLIARTGGEEFGIVLPNSSVGKAQVVAERIRQAVEKTPLKDRKNGVDYGQITLSLGVCAASECESPDQLYSCADQALYISKGKGRNQVQIYDAELMRQSNEKRALYRLK